MNPAGVASPTTPLGKKGDGTWKGIAATVFVLLVIGFTALYIILFVNSDGDGNGDDDDEDGRSDAKDAKKNNVISLDDVISDRFKPGGFEALWVSDEEFPILDKDANFVMRNIRTKENHLLVPFEEMTMKMGHHVFISTDHNYILFEELIHKVFKRSYLSYYTIYDVGAQTEFPMVSPERFPLIQVAHWGPKPHQLVFVFENNLYYIPEVKGSMTENPVQITATGVKEVIFNGVPDWTYEEHILHDHKAFWWSNEGDLLAFLYIDDSEVDETVLEDNTWSHSVDEGFVSPIELRIRYTKPGRPIPKVKLYIIDLNKLTNIITILPPEDFENTDYYLSYPQWIDNKAMLVTWTNRLQNYSEITYCREENNWRCTKHTEQKAHGRGWVYDNLGHLVAGDKFYTILPVSQGKRGYYRHLVEISLKTKEQTVLTSGHFDVLKLLKWDSKKDIVYLQSTHEGEPGERYIMAFSKKDGFYQIRKKIDENCKFNDADFNVNANYVIFRCRGPGFPKDDAWNVTSEPYFDANIVNNEVLEKRLKRYRLPIVKTVDIPIANGTYRAIVRLYIPPTYKKGRRFKYPMIVEANNEPNSQLIYENFGIGIKDYFATSRKIIYAHIDARGSSNRGEKIMHEMFKKLGTVEIEDMGHVVNELVKKFSFIDPNRIGIWGQFYGGFVAGMSLSRHDIFKCAISVNPVVDWRHYGTVYTERFMHMPTNDDNYEGYEEASLLNKEDGIKGKPYLIIYGTCDDNVHPLHSLMFAKEFIIKEIPFTIHPYPDEKHDLDNVQLHLFKKIDNFFSDCFTKKKVTTLKI